MGHVGRVPDVFRIQVLEAAVAEDLVGFKKVVPWPRAYHRKTIGKPQENRKKHRKMMIFLATMVVQWDV